MNPFRKVTEKSSFLKDGEIIVAYKAGSRGEVLATYKSANGLVACERCHNPKFSLSNIHRNIYGYGKTITLLHLGYRCVLRIRNEKEFTEALKKSATGL